jgi:pimeloyl-ACP methyl ester carboxylesterase
MTAIYAAANCPEQVLRAFLVDPPLYAPEVGLKTGLRDEREPFIGIREAAGKPASQLVEQGIPPMRAESMSKLDPATMQAVIDASAFPGWDTDALLRRIACPVRLEHGDRALGSAIYPGELERAVSQLKHCTVVHMAGTGHVPWFVDQRRFLADVAEFLDAD